MLDHPLGNLVQIAREIHASIQINQFISELMVCLLKLGQQR